MAVNPAGDSTLAYIDQTSFLGLRALGRGPLAQFTWIYEHPLDIDALARFHRNLGRGLLGRRIERSVLPFGRHRWVSLADPPGMDVAAHERPRAEVSAWSDEQLRHPIDPETGPPWRLAVQPIRGGGAGVTLIASHTVCDGLGMSLAVAEAAKGITRDLGYPPPNARSYRQALRDDLGDTLRAVPATLRAVAAGIRLARTNAGELSTSAARSTPPESLSGSEPVTVPAVCAYIDDIQWVTRAQTLWGTTNSLFAGIAARLGQRIGRVDGNGRVELSFPVSERTEGDTRGNALTGMFLTIDPTGVTTNLAGVRAEIKRNLVELAQARNDLLAPLPLVPFIPRRLARRLAGLALGTAATIGCSNLGELDPAVNRPDGTDAEYISIRQIESRITADVLDRLGGMLFLASGRVHGQVFLAVSAWRIGGPNSRDWLRMQVSEVLKEFGLPARIE